jgi:hypothetical protein
VLDYIPGDWVGESHVVHDASLFVLQIHASCFGAGQGVEMVPLFSVQCGVGRFSMSWGSRISQSLILIDTLSSVVGRKKESEMARVFFPQA